MANKKINIIGKKFNKLTVIDEVNPEKNIDSRGNKITTLMYLCRCDCGVEKIIKGSRIRSGATKSCGCLSKEVALSKIPQMIQKSTKYDLLTSLATKVWKKHYDDDGLLFDDFVELTKKNCYYCNHSPYNHLSKNGVVFSYNGLDRIDSNLGHTKDNCVPCCIICNRGKSNQPYDQAIKWMRRLTSSFDKNKIIQIDYNQLPTNTTLKYVRNIYRQLRSKTTTLSLEEFYQLSQLNCYYCNGERSNHYKNFIYNGLDRVDSNEKYIHSNVVACCKWCNFAKRNLTLDQFSDWINLLKINLQLNQY